MFALPLLSRAQDPEFTQFYEAPLHLNPAMAGTGKCSRIILNYRDQWPGISRAYITYAASYDQYFDEIKGGIGLHMLGDRSGNGIYNIMGFNGTYAYRLQINDDFNLQAGIQGGYYQIGIDQASLVFGDQLDPRYGQFDQLGNPNPTGEQINRNKVGYADFSAGLLYYGPNFFGGLAFKHITQPRIAFIGTTGNLPIRTTVHLGSILYLNRSGPNPSYISPDVLYTQQNLFQFQQLNLGLYWSNSTFSAGLGTRHAFGNSDALYFLAGFSKEFFKISYSYDLTISSLNSARPAGSHEVSMAFNFCVKRKYGNIYCPRFG